MTQNTSVSLGESPQESMPTIVTLLVNWNGADDTIECLESVLTSDYPKQVVVVVDNGSRDGSLSKLAAWAKGRFRIYPKTDVCRKWASNTCGKPIAFVKLSLDDVASGRGWDSGSALVLIDAEVNHGFAGAVNIGIRFALANSAVRYVWVLNNDTVVAPGCLSQMERRMRDEQAAGMCGSRVLFYWQPDVVQVLGGARFSPWKGTSRLIGNRQCDSRVVDVREIERSLHHLSGVSMLVSRKFLEDVGLMDESYFLYYEEADWAMRGKNRYRLVYADDAIVYHKEGASIGSSHRRENRSPLSCFFLIHSRLRFTRKFFPWALPTVFSYSALVGLRALVQGRYKQASAMFAALRGLSKKRLVGRQIDKSFD